MSGTCSAGLGPWRLTVNMGTGWLIRIIFSGSYCFVQGSSGEHSAHQEGGLRRSQTERIHHSDLQLCQEVRWSQQSQRCIWSWKIVWIRILHHISWHKIVLPSYSNGLEMFWKGFIQRTQRKLLSVYLGAVSSFGTFSEFCSELVRFWVFLCLVAWPRGKAVGDFCRSS